MEKEQNIEKIYNMLRKENLTDLEEKEIIDLINNSGIDINIGIGELSRSLFQIACINNHLKIVEKLLENKELDINKMDVNRDTALILASKSNNYNIVKRLLNVKDLDINKIANNNCSAITYACEHYKYLSKIVNARNIIIELLKTKSIDLTTGSKINGIYKSVFQWIIEEKDPLLSELLFECDIDVNMEFLNVDMPYNKAITYACGIIKLSYDLYKEYDENFIGNKFQILDMLLNIDDLNIDLYDKFDKALELNNDIRRIFEIKLGNQIAIHKKENRAYCINSNGSLDSKIGMHFIVEMVSHPANKYSIEIPSNIKNKEDIKIYKYDDSNKINSKTSVPGIRTQIENDKLRNKILNCFLSKVGCIENTRNGKIIYKQINQYKILLGIDQNISRYL